MIGIRLLGAEKGPSKRSEFPMLIETALELEHVSSGMQYLGFLCKAILSCVSSQNTKQEEKSLRLSDLPCPCGN